jgi:hypothetical protein
VQADACQTAGATNSAIGSRCAKRHERALGALMIIPSEQRTVGATQRIAVAALLAAVEAHAAQPADRSRHCLRAIRRRL